jgi:hypothetical protein
MTSLSAFSRLSLQLCRLEGNRPRVPDRVPEADPACFPWDEAEQEALAAMQRAVGWKWSRPMRSAVSARQSLTAPRLGGDDAADGRAAFGISRSRFFTLTLLDALGLISPACSRPSL